MSAKKRRFAEGTQVAIGHPDLWDLESALDRLLVDFDWSEHRSKPLEAKAALVAELAREFPASVAVYDIDSLDAEAENAIEYLTHDLTAAGAKVLLTSRRAIIGMGKATRRAPSAPCSVTSHAHGDGECREDDRDHGSVGDGGGLGR